MEIGESFRLSCCKFSFRRKLTQILKFFHGGPNFRKEVQSQSDALGNKIKTCQRPSAHGALPFVTAVEIPQSVGRFGGLKMNSVILRLAAIIVAVVVASSTAYAGDTILWRG